MANDLITRVYWTKVNDPTMKSVLVALADQAGSEGFCWPCIETIVERTEWSERSVQMKLRKLEQEGYIRSRPRKDRSTQYIINVDRLAERRPETSRLKETGPWEEQNRKDRETRGAGDAPDLFGTGAGDSLTGAGDSLTGAGRAPRTIIEPSLEPSLYIGSHPFTRNADMVEWVCNRWNEFAAANPAVSSVRVPISEERAALIVRRATSQGKGQDKLLFWSEFFNHLENSRFLRGLVPPTDRFPKPFGLRLSWALKTNNFADIMDGFYDKSSEDNSYRGRGSAMDAADRFASRVDAR